MLEDKTNSNNNQTEEAPEEQTPAPIVMGSRADEIAKCSQCEKEFTIGKMNAFQGKNGEDIYFCEECIKQINEELAKETKDQNILGAVTLGVISGILGGILWYLITVLFNWQIGYMAIALGWLIAMGVHVGSGYKKGKNLQVISAMLMIIILLSSEFMIFLHYTGQSPNWNTTSFNVLSILIQENNLGAAISSFFSQSTSPIGLLIWGIGIYTAYIILKPVKLQ